VPPSPPPQKLCTSSVDEFANVTAHRYTFYELERATSNFEKNIGSGGFGVVYYGKTKDEKEIAVKVLTNESAQGRKQFSNEVVDSFISLRDLFPSICSMHITFK
jgi:hypothetical protein